jgi:hypothetical protein
MKEEVKRREGGEDRVGVQFWQIKITWIVPNHTEMV